MNNKYFGRMLMEAERFLGDDMGDVGLEANVPVDGAEEVDALGIEDLGDEEVAGEEDEPEMIPCPDCDGEGVITDEDGEEVECETCGGSGEVEADEAEYDFDPAEGVCPCCGAKLNCIGDCDDEEELDDEDLGDEELDDEDLGDEELDDPTLEDEE